MKKKKILMMIVLALTGSFLFAGGVGEALGDFLLPAIAGAAGFLVNPVMGILGVTAGLITGGLNMANNVNAKEEQKDKDAVDAYNAAMDRYNAMDAAVDNAELDILQAQGTLSEYDQALARLPGQLDIERQQMGMQGQAQYSQLMNNWQGAELANVARGLSGGS